MSSYNTKGVVNRYWKRPKPRVYECNIRDAERFYNQSYKDYLEAKEAAAKRDVGSRLLDDATEKWRVQRSNSLFDTMTDSLLDNSTKSNHLNSSSSPWQNGESSFSGTSKYRASSLSKAASKEMDDDGSYFEERIQRVQKLRSELGLPTEIGVGQGGSNRATSKVTFDLPTETTTSSFTMRRVSSPDPRGLKGRSFDNSSESSSFTSTRSTRRSREPDVTSDSLGDVLSTGTERRARYSSKFNSLDDSYNLANGKTTHNGGASSLDNDIDKYSSSKSSLKSSRKFDLDNDSFSSKPSESSSSFISSRKVTAITSSDPDDCDADAFLSNIRKKFPTSDEIMERIKKMDSEI